MFSCSGETSMVLSSPVIRSGQIRGLLKKQGGLFSLSDVHPSVIFPIQRYGWTPKDAPGPGICCCHGYRDWRCRRGRYVDEGPVEFLTMAGCGISQFVYPEIRSIPRKEMPVACLPRERCIGCAEPGCNRLKPDTGCRWHDGGIPPGGCIDRHRGTTIRGWYCRWCGNDTAFFIHAAAAAGTAVKRPFTTCRAHDITDPGLRCRDTPDGMTASCRNAVGMTGAFRSRCRWDGGYRCRRGSLEQWTRYRWDGRCRYRRCCLEQRDRYHRGTGWPGMLCRAARKRDGCNADDKERDYSWVHTEPWLPDLINKT